MSIPTKPFYAHSERWVKAKQKAGLDPKRWDAWLRLSKKTRQSSSAEEYAKGVSVAEQRKRAALNSAIDRAMKWAGSNAPDRIVFEKRMKKYALADWRKFASMTDHKIRSFNMNAYRTGGSSPFWYH